MVKLEADLQVNTVLCPKSFLLVPVSVLTIEGSLKYTVSASLDGQTCQTEVTFNSSAQQLFSQKSKESTSMNNNEFQKFCFFPGGKHT